MPDLIEGKTRILIRSSELESNDPNDWDVTEPAKVVDGNHSFLQNTLAALPWLISQSGIKELKSDLLYAVKEFPTTLGNIDVLALSRLGDICIIECKDLIKEPGADKKIVGQVGDYVEAIKKMTIEDFQRAYDKASKHAVECNFELDEGATLGLRRNKLVIIAVRFLTKDVKDRIGHMLRNKDISTAYALAINKYEMIRLEMVAGTEQAIKLKEAFALELYSPQAHKKSKAKPKSKSKVTDKERVALPVSK